MDGIFDPNLNDDRRDLGLLREENSIKGRAGCQWGSIKGDDAIFSTRDFHFWSGIGSFKNGEIDRASNSTPTARSHNSSTNSAANPNASAPTTNPCSNSAAAPSSRETQRASKGSGVCIQF